MRGSGNSVVRAHFHWEDLWDKWPLVIGKLFLLHFQPQGIKSTFDKSSNSHYITPLPSSWQTVFWLLLDWHEKQPNVNNCKRTQYQLDSDQTGNSGRYPSASWHFWYLVENSAYSHAITVSPKKQTNKQNPQTPKTPPAKTSRYDSVLSEWRGPVVAAVCLVLMISFSLVAHSNPYPRFTCSTESSSRPLLEIHRKWMKKKKDLILHIHF